MFVRKASQRTPSDRRSGGDELAEYAERRIEADAPLDVSKETGPTGPRNERSE